MPRRVLTDNFDVTFTRDELMTVLRLVRRDLTSIPAERDWCETSVWESRQKRLRELEEKIITSYNMSGTEILEEGEEQCPESTT